MSKPHAPRSVFTNPIHFVAFGFGSGAIPFAPGTWGTVMGVPIYYLLHSFGLVTYAIVTVLIILVGTWISDITERDLGVPDHSGIVIDEIAGFLVTMMFVPHSLFWVIAGFILFRIFDIWKPFPIRYLDQKVSGGVGIMLDDIVAGIYAALVLWAMMVWL